MSESLVSIVIPVFNRKEFVKKMIESIIKQTYKIWELILVDDGSTDGTLEMCKEFAKADNRIHIHIRNVNAKGAPVCRNIGLKLAKGEYLLFFDSDDLVPPFCLQQRVDYMANHPSLDFAIFPTIAFQDKIGDVKFYSGIYVSSHDLRHLIDGLLPFLVFTNIYRRNFLSERNILWDENMKFFQDQDYNIQCILKNACYEYATDAQFDYYYRSIPNSEAISKKIGRPENFDGFLYFMEKLFSLPHNSIKSNKWAIRRRMIYIYKSINSRTQKLQFVSWTYGKDKYFNFLFKLSSKLYNLLISTNILTEKYAFILAFPYYSLYNKFYLMRCRYLVNKKFDIHLINSHYYM